MCVPGDVATDEGLKLRRVQVVKPLGCPFDDGQTLLPGQGLGRLLEEERGEDRVIIKSIWSPLHC